MPLAMMEASTAENADGLRRAEVTAGGTPESSAAMLGGGRRPASMEEISARIELETEAGTDLL